ncbi:MAG: enoyl-CoA hydratase/isomerase family protein [Desulfurococcales archaeon]|nr:enoyl-CoA hydratase/isomerase family protein [Desulfurococcales archaeon]
MAEIILNRPGKRNAMTKRMWARLASCTETYCRDDKVKVLVYRGMGGAFSAGDDIGEMLYLKDSGEADDFFDTLAWAFTALLECTKPTIAIVEGPAVGGGAELLLAIDYVIATPDATIGFPEIHIGLIPPVLLTLGAKILGTRKARHLALTGKLLDPGEAMDLGIVDTVTSDPEAELESAISFFTSLPEAAVSSVKRILAAQVERSVLLAALEALKKLSISQTAKERMKAFLEKRLPRPSLDP